MVARENMDTYVVFCCLIENLSQEWTELPTACTRNGPPIQHFVPQEPGLWHGVGGLLQNAPRFHRSGGNISAKPRQSQGIRGQIEPLGQNNTAIDSWISLPDFVWGKSLRVGSPRHCPGLGGGKGGSNASRTEATGLTVLG